MTSILTTDIRPRSNTIVEIPNFVLYPGIGSYYSLMQPGVTSNLFVELVANGRSGIFQNPVAANLDNTAAVANSLITSIQNPTSILTAAQKANLFSTLISNAAYVLFETGKQPAATSNVEVFYQAKGNVSIKDVFKATGAQTVFSLSNEPQQNISCVFVNGVHQSNTSYAFIPKVFGIEELCKVVLKDHTNRLSGLARAENPDDIDLEKVLSVGTALNTLANGLDGDDTANNSNAVFYCMSALFCSNLLSQYRETMKVSIETEVKSNTLNVITGFTSLREIANGLQNIVSSDVAYYRQMQEELTWSTLASFVNSIYSEPSGQTLLGYVIGTDKLKQIFNTPEI